MFNDFGTSDLSKYYLLVHPISPRCGHGVWRRPVWGFISLYPRRLRPQPFNTRHSDQDHRRHSDQDHDQEHRRQRPKRNGYCLIVSSNLILNHKKNWTKNLEIKFSYRTNLTPCRSVVKGQISWPVSEIRPPIIKYLVLKCWISFSWASLR